MLPDVEVIFTMLPATGPATFSVAPETLYVPVVVSAWFVKPQFAQLPRVTVPLAVSLAFMLPLFACNVKEEELTVSGILALPIEPLLLTSTTEPALLRPPPDMPLPLVTILPLPLPAPVDCRKKVPVLLTVEGATVIVAPLL
jgi:hypothetical protein